MSDTKTDGKVRKSEAEWRKELTPMQYAVLREKATERPFTGEYEHDPRKGTYVCAGCGQTLFESDQKFDSGCGWPSFSKPAIESHVDEERDVSHGMIRTEVLCSKCDGHLGHVFNDGPALLHQLGGAEAERDEVGGHYPSPARPPTGRAGLCFASRAQQYPRDRPERLTTRGPECALLGIRGAVGVSPCGCRLF